MKIYYHSKHDNKFGPYSLEEIREKLLDKTDLVWKEGLEGWVEAFTLDELKGFLKLNPPPLPNEKKKPNINPVIDIKSDKIHDNKKRINGAFSIGVFALLFHLVVYFFLNNKTIESNTYKSIGILYIIIRVVITVFIVSIANRLNRDKLSWGTFSFLFPVITSIILGLLKRKSYKIEAYEGYTTEKKLHFYKTTIVNLIDEERIDNALELTNYIIQNKIDSSSENIKLYAIVFYKNGNYNKMINTININTKNSVDNVLFDIVFLILNSSDDINLNEHMLDNDSWEWLKQLNEPPLHMLELKNEFALERDFTYDIPKIKIAETNNLDIEVGSTYKLEVNKKGILLKNSEKGNWFIGGLTINDMKKEGEGVFVITLKDSSFLKISVEMFFLPDYREGGIEDDVFFMLDIVNGFRKNIANLIIDQLMKEYEL